jgi:hypothetical protein
MTDVTDIVDGGMPDNSGLSDIGLRDRIAAVLRQVLFGNGGDGDVEPEVLADAVIAELGLYREGTESRTVTNEFGATYRIEGGHRYVTDWKADDE